MYIFLFLAFIVQTGVFDLDLVHRSYPGVWRKEIPQSLESQMVSSFSSHTSTHHSVHRAGDQVHPHPAVYRQGPHTVPTGWGKELENLGISNEWKNGYLKQWSIHPESVEMNNGFNQESIFLPPRPEVCEQRRKCCLTLRTCEIGREDHFTLGQWWMRAGPTLSSRLALWLHTQKLLLVGTMLNLLSCKFQGKYMQLPSLVHRLSGVKERGVKWWPLIKAVVGRTKEKEQMK